MSVPIVELAEEIKSLLNAGPWNPSLAATREYQPYFELPALPTAKVSVYPSADDSTGKADRSRWTHELTIDVAVQRKLSGDANPEKDALVALADEICEYIKANRPARPEKLMTATVRPLIQNELLRSNNLFTSVCRFTFTAHR